MKKKHEAVTGLGGLLVLAVFALCILLVLLTGADLYRGLVESGEESYLRRTALQYLTTRVRQAESVEIGSFDGCDALILEEEGALTRVYCYDGWLRELYTVPEATASAGAGEKLLEAESLTLKREENLLTLTLDGETLYLWLPTGKEAAYEE